MYIRRREPRSGLFSIEVSAQVYELRLLVEPGAGTAGLSGLDG